MQTENIIELLAAYALPINVNEHPLGNIFISENKSVPTSLPTVLKKPSLPTSNPLESIKSICNLGNLSQNDFDLALSMRLANLIQRLLPTLLIFKVFILLGLP